MAIFIIFRLYSLNHHQLCYFYYKLIFKVKLINLNLIYSKLQTNDFRFKFYSRAKPKSINPSFPI